MNRRFFIALALSAATFFVLNYVIQRNQPKNPHDAVPATAVPGQSYRVPTKEDLLQPIKRDVDFAESKREKEDPVISTVTTDTYIARFSSHGGVLTQLDFQKHKGVDGVPLRTVHPRTFYEREQDCFLLAFDQQTPYIYSLRSCEEDQDGARLVYETKMHGWHIEKKYTLHKDSYIVDLELVFEPLTQDAEPLAPRLFFNAPFAPHVQADRDVIYGVTLGADAKAVHEVSAIEQRENAWVMPALFGAHDKYFAHIMVKDGGHFMQRAFFKNATDHALSAVLEGRKVAKPASYSLSFYFGPKLLPQLQRVDPRLEGLLSFGWLAWLCKFFLNLLEILVSFVGNYGLAIILVTILIKLPLMPFAVWAREKMVRFQQYQPAINRIRQKHRNDLGAQQSEMMRFYKDHNISPATPLLGLLPMVIHIIFFIGLYRVLSNYIELYQAPFFGWIVDLSAQDPYYVLPILTGLVMYWWQSRQQVTDRRQKIIYIFVTLIATAMFARFPAGLSLFWIMSNFMLVVEDYLRAFWYA